VLTPLQSSKINPRRSVAGVLLLATVLLTLSMLIIGAVSPEINLSVLRILSGLTAFAAALLLVPDVDYRQQRTVTALLVLGLALIWYASRQGAEFQIADVLTKNTALLMMILSVSALKLVTLPSGAAPTGELPKGPKAFRNTLISVALFGSVINISAPLVIADRLHAARAVDFFTARSVIRKIIIITICSVPCAIWRSSLVTKDK